MKTSDCFSELKTKANELVSFLEFLIDLNLPWEEHFGFEMIPIENCWIEKETALQEIDKINPIKQLILLKIPSKSFYNWHVDDFRQSCINLLVSKNHHSYSMFGEHKNKYYYTQQKLYYHHQSQPSSMVPLDCLTYLLLLYSKIRS